MIDPPPLVTWEAWTLATSKTHEVCTHDRLRAVTDGRSRGADNGSSTVSDGRGGSGDDGSSTGGDSVEDTARTAGSSLESTAGARGDGVKGTDST